MIRILFTTDPTQLDQIYTHHVKMKNIICATMVILNLLCSLKPYLFIMIFAETLMDVDNTYFIPYKTFILVERTWIHLWVGGGRYFLWKYFVTLLPRKKRRPKLKKNGDEQQSNNNRQFCNDCLSLLLLVNQNALPPLAQTLNRKLRKQILFTTLLLLNYLDLYVLLVLLPVQMALVGLTYKPLLATTIVNCYLSL